MSQWHKQYVAEEMMAVHMVDNHLIRNMQLIRMKK